MTFVSQFQHCFPRPLKQSLAFKTDHSLSKVIYLYYYFKHVKSYEKNGVKMSVNKNPKLLPSHQACIYIQYTNLIFGLFCQKATLKEKKQINKNQYSQF